MSDVPWEVFSHIPGIGELIGSLKILASLLLTYVDRDRALEDSVEKMQQTYEDARSFIEVYSLVIATWGAWKAGLATSMTECIGSYLRDFMPFDDLSQNA